MMNFDLTPIGRDEIVEIYLQVEESLRKARKTLKELQRKHPNNNEMWESQEENVEKLIRNEKTLREYIIKHFGKDPRTLN